MTARPEFGAAIAVEGVRPAWLPDDVKVKGYEQDGRIFIGSYPAQLISWERQAQFSLEVPRYDFVYLALERGMVPNMGASNDEPADWDQNPDTVLYRDGRTGANCHHIRSPNAWEFSDVDSDIIGYTRKATSTALPLAHPAAPQGEEERLREALRKVKQAARYVAVGDGYFDPYANHIEAVDAIVDAALAPAAIASGREGA